MVAEVRKSPLLLGQFVWVASKKDGTIKLIIGPDPLEVTEDDIPMMPNAQNPWEFGPVEITQAVQRFVTLKPHQYAVIHNPVDSDTDTDYPNGKYNKGKNEMKPLKYGTKRVVIAGHFPVWPGQWVEVREIHRLDSKQYITVVVEKVPVDVKAPYYELTVACADIKKAVVDENTVSKEPAKEVVNESGNDPAKGTESAQNQNSSQPAATSEKPQATVQPAATSEKPQAKVPEKPQVSPLEKGVSGKDPDAPVFKVGQRIIIPGSKTETYIPPTGIEVDRNKAVKQPESTRHLDPKEELQDKITSGQIKIETMEQLIKRVGLEDDLFEAVRDRYTSLREAGKNRNALYEAITSIFDRSHLMKLLSIFMENTAVNQQATRDSDEAVCEAVVLGPTEFCVVVDENGMPNSHKGPGRVFPGPNDTFRTQGSRNRVYDAYHLREDRGLLLRVVADQITKKDLLEKLPEAVANQLNKEKYTKGDEIFISGFDAYLVPYYSVFEVIDPETRNPHIGNSHGGVYVQAIGIDQKSGIYVMKVETGEVELVKGKAKLLLDPRKQKHMKRRVPGKIWNLLIGYGEPHKAVSPDSVVESPWALSVQVPNNMAMLLTSRTGRRVVLGPQTTLLEFDESPEILHISVNRPKTEKDTKQTVFLWVTGNRPTDQVELITADKAVIKVDVQYEVEFSASDPKEQEKWFLYKNYVWMLASNARSRLRNAAEQVSFAVLKDSISEFVRNVILGKKPEGVAHRPGLPFETCNLRVTEVEVLDWVVDDPEIAKALATANKAAVNREIQVGEEKSALEAEQAKDQIAVEKAALVLRQTKRSAETELGKRRIVDESEKSALQISQEREARMAEAELTKSRLVEQTAAVKDEINIEAAKRTAAAQLEQSQIIDQKAAKELELKKAAALRDAAAKEEINKQEQALKKLVVELQQEIELIRLANCSVLSLKQQELDIKMSDVNRELHEKDTRSQMALKAEDDAKLVEFSKALADIQAALYTSEAEADAKRIAALQEKLVEAIEGLGNKQVLAELAQHLPGATGTLGLLLGKGGLDAIEGMCGGTKLIDAIHNLTGRIQQHKEESAKVGEELKS
ncbi:MAG: hypothetical protein NTX82_06570 [Candidatus Parcubacteria bacterium]|nr:hypothetical protein [Candidatus Parcubacteria bacterium]